MNFKTFFFAALGLYFIALTGWAIYDAGSATAILAWLDSPLGLQVVADLLTALTFAALWIARDAKQRGINPLPFVLLMVLLGSGGPLLYMAMRSAKKPAEMNTKACAAAPSLQAA
ncbi:MAG: hypothetical protein OEZ06_29320 [Myxococcales bacterium]|nr:hypothetical protein [Myxococcales bacterium]